MEFFSPGGRLSLALDDIDPAHTAGAMAVARRDLLAALAAEGLVEANRTRPLPRLPLRLGLVTRGGSQAYHDVTDELAASGLPFEVLLVSCGVQGAAAAEELAAAVRLVQQRSVDLLLLTRGGGADTDLMTFDDGDLARAVSTCPVQVWTGIGHHLDTPVCEQVAARAFKTPTALAQGVVGAALDAVGATERSWDAIRRRAEDHLGRASGRLDLARRRTQTARTVLRGHEGRLVADTARLASAARRQLATSRAVLDGRTARLGEAADATVATATRRLDVTAGLVAAYDPARLLGRGWSVTTTADGRLVTGPVPVGTRLRTTTLGGMISSEVVDDG
jgi:exodeoxyribonuclease VII large subunit